VPITNISALTTQADLPAVSTSSLSFSPAMVDGLPLEEQTTWIIPVAPGGRGTAAPQVRDLEEGGYSSQIRRLIKSSGIYALASLASPLISLVLAPFLTHNLSRADYGLLAVLNTAIALMAGITQLGLSSAFFRSYNYDYDSQRDRSNVLSTVVILLLLVSLLAALAMVAGAPWLATHLLSSPSGSDLVRLAGLAVLLQNLTVPGFAWLRAENRAGFFSTLSIANLLITLGATIALVGKMQMGLAGALLATALGSAIVVICTLPIMLLRAGVRLRFDIAWGLLTFGVPNVANFVSVWILQLSDRYLLSHLASLAQTASYSVAYSLGGVVSVVVIAPFSLAWPTALYSIARRKDAAYVFQLVFRWYSIALLFAVFALSLVATFMLDLLFPPAYHSAAPIISIIAVSIMFYGIYNIFLVGVSIQRKTWLAVIFTTLSALVNIGCNLILIPRYGSMGAAVSTLIAYVLLAFVAYIVNQRIYPVPFGIGIFIIALFIGVALYVGSNFLIKFQETTYQAWAISLATLSLYSGFLLIVGRLPAWKGKLRYRDTKEGSLP
jgi:O-antigen/teichoic acid export membrane protein